MHKLYTAILVTTIVCLGNMHARAGQKLRVFFIGNSYTHTNNMPGMIADIATSMGDTLIWEDHTPGGWTLDKHWAPPQDPCVGKIKSRNWDYVVLQEQSQHPAYRMSGFTISTYTYAQQFTRLMRDSSVCTTPMFYMTWGYKNGDSSNCPSILHMCTYESMDSVIRERYMLMADSFDAVVSPVGAVRRHIRLNHPGIELYMADGSHPSVAGTYAAACCFYTALFKRDPSLTTYTAGLPAADVAILKNAAKTVVYDSLTKWGLGIYDLSPMYEYNISGTQVTFTNKSSPKAQTYSWNFGNGTTSIQKNPVHNYAAKGDYTVTLTVYDANGCSRIISKKVNLFPADINNIKNNSFTISPNPAKESITIQTNQSIVPLRIRITDAMGQSIYTGNTNGTRKIDISAFSSGIYYIILYNNEGLHHDKFIKL